MSIENLSHRTVFIRTDANPVIAGGHIMRCLAAAEAISNFGADVRFVLSDDNPTDVIENGGYRTIVLESDWRNIEEGAGVLCHLCDEVERPIVLVDTYSITKEYVNRLAKHAKVCYLGSKGGDLGALSLIVDYSTDADEDAYLGIYGKRGTRLLLGAGYAPLRDCFARAYRKRSGIIERVLVTTGNTDQCGFLPAFLRMALDDERLGGIEFEVVVGRMFSDVVAGEVEEIVERYPSVEALHAVTDMAGLMCHCDVAVTANGTTVYELAAAGVPAITFAMVGEQVRSAESLSRLGATLYCGIASSDIEVIAAGCVDGLARLVASHEKAAVLAERAHALVDGRGAEKIAKEIMSL